MAWTFYPNKHIMDGNFYFARILNESAKNAVLKMKFKPAMIGKKPVKSWTSIPVL